MADIINEGRGRSAVFVTGIYAPLPKLFALRRGFRPDFFDNRVYPQMVELNRCSGVDPSASLRVIDILVGFHPPQR
jgi:hypothetical protein